MISYNSDSGWKGHGVYRTTRKDVAGLFLGVSGISPVLLALLSITC